MVGVLIGVWITGTAMATHQEFFVCQPRWLAVETLMKMNMTDQQKHAMAVILRKHRRAFQPVIASLKSARLDLRRAMRAEPTNKKDLLDAYHRLCTSGEYFLLLMTEMLSQIKATLTPAQLRILKEGQSKLDKAIENRIQSRQALLNHWIEIHVH